MMDLEKAARAACEALSPVTGRPMLGDDPDFNDRPNIEAGRDGDELLECEVIALVRAVLGAIREPESSVLDVVEYDSHGWAARNFTAMIDHICEGKRGVE